MDEREFRQELTRNLNRILSDKQRKEIVVWGIGSGGKIVSEVLSDNGVAIDHYVDKKHGEISEFNEKPVADIKTFDKNSEYLIVSMRKASDEIDEILVNMDLDPSDYFYPGDIFFFNREDIDYRGCRIGRYTYGYRELLESFPMAESIGRFCSICGSARIYNNHPMECITTHPILDHRSFHKLEEMKRINEYCKKYGRYDDNAVYENSPLRDNKPVIIENDVWIGANVVILPGVHIGNGAVLAAGAVVNKDVDDYAIVGGVPAKLIRYRFNEEDRKKMLEISWWDWPVEMIEDNLELFYQPEKFMRRFHE